MAWEATEAGVCWVYEPHGRPEALGAWEAAPAPSILDSDPVPCHSPLALSFLHPCAKAGGPLPAG